MVRNVAHAARRVALARAMLATRASVVQRTAIATNVAAANGGGNARGLRRVGIARRFLARL